MIYILFAKGRLHALEGEKTALCSKAFSKREDAEKEVEPFRQRCLEDHGNLEEFDKEEEIRISIIPIELIP